MSAATHHAGAAPYYFVPAPSRHPALTAASLLLVIFGAGQWVNGDAWGKWFVSAASRCGPWCCSSGSATPSARARAACTATASTSRSAGA